MFESPKNKYQQITEGAKGDELFEIAQGIENETLTFTFPGISDDGLKILRSYENDPYFEMSGARPIDEVLHDCMQYGMRIIAIRGGAYAVPANCPRNKNEENSSTISLRHLHVTAYMDQDVAALIHNAKRK
jgi:hypothetical protein